MPRSEAKERIAMSNPKWAQIRRINRKLAHMDQRLHVSRGWRELQNLGEYHIVDIYRNAVLDWGVNLDDLESELQNQAA